MFIIGYVTQKVSCENEKLECFCLNWKESSEVGKNPAKPESFFRSKKVWLKLRNYAAVGEFE